MIASLRRSLFIIALVFIIGTLGFYFLLTEMTLLDSFYLTVTTLTTVGYGDFSPHTNLGQANPYLVKLFAVALILFGIGAFLHALALVTEYVVSGEMGQARRQKRMRRLISRLKDHYIICGAGETGLYIMEELEKTARKFVVIDTDIQRLEFLAEKFKLLCYIVGDATEEKFIEQAGLAQAECVILAMPDEKDVLSTVIGLNYLYPHEREFKIIARALSREKSESKLKKAGADVIVCPYDIAGERMVSEMFRPSVTTFLQQMLGDERAIYRFEEAKLEEHSPLVSKKLASSRVRELTGLIIMAIYRPEEQNFIYVPDAEETLRSGDHLIALGDMKSFIRLRKLARGIS